MKKCPYCAEEIQDEDIVCRYCLRDLWPISRRTRFSSGHLMSSIEYVLRWLKKNDPELYGGIMAKIAETKGKPVSVKSTP
jgi:hypothetical protein